MNNKLRLTFFAACAIGLLFIGGCKKNPTVIGSWNLTAVSFSNVSVAVGTSSTTTVTFPSAGNGLTSTTVTTPGTTTTTNSYIPYTLSLTINSDGTYSATETYTPSGGTSGTYTSKANWEYASNSNSNDAITFWSTNPNSVFFGNGNTFIVNSISSSQMVLGGNTSTTNTTTTGTTSYSSTGTATFGH
jgi:hypothetical protein